MEIRERIEVCLNALNARQVAVNALQERVRGLIDALRSDGETPGSLGEIIRVLEAVLQSYAEISASCHQMIMGLREIGEHIDKIDNGRKKIVAGVETILRNLTQLDEIAAGGIRVGINGPPGPDGTPAKKIVLIRVRPQEPKDAAPHHGPRRLTATEESLGSDDLDADEAEDAIIH
jgi:hypothetical protein